MKIKALIVGGSSGLGLAFAHKLLSPAYDCERLYVLDRVEPQIADERIVFVRHNLLADEMEVFDRFKDINTLIITAGFGRVAPFDELLDIEIVNSFKVNTLATVRIIKHFYERMRSADDFYTLVMGSVSGMMSSPLFAVYGATKAAVDMFAESVNTELELLPTANRILNVAPGSLKGTSFNGDKTSLETLSELTDTLLERLFNRETLYIPQYEEVYKNVLHKYRTDPHQSSVDSYNYKLASGRINHRPQVKIGYLSGTFDLFHIGHLNLLRRAKDYCDYLVVGVHESGARKGKETFIPFEERLDIVRSVRYVDRVMKSYLEDADAWQEVQYDYLFVGSDYKGSERFARYEEFFRDKDVKIIYFPYTQGTSSTQIRRAIEGGAKN